MIKQVLSGARWYVVNMAHWFPQRRTGESGPSVWIDVHENIWHRYLHIFLLFLRIRGYTVHVRHRWGFIGCWASFELFRLSSQHVRFYFRNAAIPAGAWLFTDRPTARPHVLLDADHFTIPGEVRSGFRVPMALFYTIYAHGIQDRFPVDPSAPRERVVFFFGNMDPKAYVRNEVQAVFGCFNRMHLLQLVRSEFADQVYEPHKLGALDARGERHIVLVDRAHAHIDTRNLLPILSRYDFFLAPSGVVMPLCHNLVEALCAGCIPILQHPHLMEPPLRHGVDCLSFTTEQELVELLRNVPMMDAGTVLQMRRNALAYYQRYLTPEAVVGEMEKQGAKLQRLLLNGEYVSVELLRKKLQAKGIEGPLPRS